MAGILILTNLLPVILTTSGNISFSVPSGKVIRFVVVEPTVGFLFSIGTTNGGSEISAGVNVAAGDSVLFSIDKTYNGLIAEYGSNVIWFNGALNTVTYKIYFR